MIKTLSTLNNELQKRKLDIVRLLAALLLMISLITGLGYVVTFILDSQRYANPIYLVSSAIILLTIIASSYIRYSLAYKNVELAFTFILLILTVASNITLLNAGIDSAVGYLLLIMAILAGCVVYGVKQGFMLFWFFTAIQIVIFSLHKFELYRYEIRTTPPEYLDAVVVVFFSGVITMIAKIAYDQIEHSYQKAFDYASELEELNKDLDMQVKTRTKELQKSFERQADSIYSQAVVGSITQPLLHDIGTPISALKGALLLSKQSTDPKETEEMSAMAEKSLEQLERIVDNAKNLIRGDILTVKFSPYELIDIALLISKNDLQKNGIEITTKVDKDITIEGTPNLFERVVINIIKNAIEELAQQKGRKREIVINGKEDGDFFVLSIKDSGRGIEKAYLEKIFDPYFSLNKPGMHLGFGLPFVKSIIEKNFAGEIKIFSQPNKYSEFVLKFALKNGTKPREGY